MNCLYCNTFIEKGKFCSHKCSISYQNGRFSRNFDNLKNDLLCVFKNNFIKNDLREFCKKNQIPYRKSINFLRSNNIVCSRKISEETKNKLRQIQLNKIHNIQYNNNDVKKIQELYLQQNYSFLELIQLGYCKKMINYALKGKKRSKSEANHLAHIKYPESFKHTEKTKEKIRKARVNYLKLQTGKTAFERRYNGEMSHGEQALHDIFLKNDIYKKYDVVNEYCEYPYFIDFAFVNEKVGVEFDGEWHFTTKRQLYDTNRDSILNEKGWRIFRIAYYELQNFDIKKLLDFIGNPKDKRHSCDLIQYKELKINKAKNKLMKKQEKKEVNRLKHNEKINNRKKILSSINFDERGAINKVALLLNISHTSVRRFLKKYMKESHNANTRRS